MSDKQSTGPMIPAHAQALGLRHPVAMIAAVGKNGVIGRDGDLPWRLPSDLQFFKQRTIGKPIVMGRKQYQSVGKPLPQRENIVLTRDPAFRPDGVVVFTELADALRHADDVAQETGAAEIMIIGGGEIYRLAMPYAARLYLSEVDLRPEGDVLFPAVDPAQWIEVARNCLAVGPRDDASATLVVLERRS